MAIDDKLISRINQLANKKKSVGLTNEEQKEQKILRQEYLQAFRGNMRQILDNTDIVKEFSISAFLVNQETLKILTDHAAILKIEKKKADYILTYKVNAVSENEILQLISK